MADVKITISEDLMDYLKHLVATGECRDINDAIERVIRIAKKKDPDFIPPKQDDKYWDKGGRGVTIQMKTGFDD